MVQGQLQGETSLNGIFSRISEMMCAKIKIVFMFVCKQMNYHSFYIHLFDYFVWSNRTPLKSQ